MTPGGQPLESVSPAPVPGPSPVVSSRGCSWLTLLLVVLLENGVIAGGLSWFLFKRPVKTAVDPALTSIHARLGEIKRALETRPAAATRGPANVPSAAGRVETDESVLVATQALVRSLNERDAEIKRLRQGHDTEVFRRFLARFVKARQAVEDFSDEGSPGASSFEQVGRLFDDAFEECGVERFAPRPGDDFRSAKGVSDTPKRIKPTRSEDEFKIASVIEPGYRMRGGNGDVIVPARVSVYMP